MAITQDFHQGDGTEVTFSYSFPFLKESDFYVTLDGVTQASSTYTINTFSNQVVFDTAPTNGAKVRFYRLTDVNEKDVTFFSGSALRAQDLNSNFDQVNFRSQEVENYIWFKEGTTVHSDETWVSSDDQIATTAAMDARFQDELSETITSAESWPDDDNTIATTAAIDNRIDTAITNDIGTNGTGITVTDDGDGTITLGLANIDLDRIKSTDVITSSESWPNNDTTIATTAMIDDQIDAAFTTNIATSDGVSLTDDGDGTITLGLTAGAVDLDRIKAEDIVVAGESWANNDTTIATTAATEDHVNTLIAASGTDLSYTAGTRVLASSTGTDATLPEVDSSNSGLMTSAQKTKLDGLAQSDWNASSGGAEILNKPTIPTNNNQLTNGAGYITADTTKLPLAGGTMSGAIAMGSNKITGLGTPTASADAATKAYVDSQSGGGGGGGSGVTDGDKGDITVSSSGATWTIDDGVVTYAKMQDVSTTNRLIGRTTAGAGDPEEITPANARTMLNVADGANNYTHPNHSGDVTSNADGATTIADDAVTYAKMQDLASANRVLGGTAAGTIGEVQVQTDMIADDAVTAAKLADTSVTAGSYTTADITVDAQGRITSASSGSGGGGGLTGFTSSDNTSSPNDTDNVSAISVDSTSTDGYFAIIPKGTGGIVAAIPDGTYAGGNTRGDYSVDLQLSTGSGTPQTSWNAHVASADYSGLFAGKGNKASNVNSVCLGGEYNEVVTRYSGVFAGRTNDTSGNADYAVILGGNGHDLSGADYSAMVGGYRNDCFGERSVILGGAYNTDYGTWDCIVFGAGDNHNNPYAGNNQSRRHMVGVETSNATQTTLTSDHNNPYGFNGTRLILGSNTINYVTVRTIATTQDAAVVKVWDSNLVVRAPNSGSGTIEYESSTVLFADTSASSWDIDFAANMTDWNSRGVFLDIKVTGAASTDIRWSAQTDSTEVMTNSIP